MCRHLAYLGPPIPLSALLFDPPHGLSRQSWAPRDMRGGGTINADGFGVGWHTPAGPVRYRRATPLWNDASLPGLASSVTATSVLAAVRSATVGMPVTEAAAAPFADDRWLFSHNGVVRGWPQSMAKLAGTLPVTDLLTLDAPTDSALLWALLRAHLAVSDPVSAVSSVVAKVERAAPQSRLNLLLTDGVTIVATTAGHALSVRHDDNAVLVSSEPLDDDPGWQPVPEKTLLVAGPAGVEFTSLGDA
jgi:gamma-glutamyl hercynylcysteine S-oxide hydrolase